MTPPEDDAALRRRYEAAVHHLAGHADALRRRGQDAEAIGRELVATRNTLKREYRLLTTPALVPVIEARNRVKYGDPLGPTADMLLSRYGNWDAVIEAACRSGGDDLKALLSKPGQGMLK